MNIKIEAGQCVIRDSVKRMRREYHRSGRPVVWYGWQEVEGIALDYGILPFGAYFKAKVYRWNRIDL